MGGDERRGMKGKGGWGGGGQEGGRDREGKRGESIKSVNPSAHKVASPPLHNPYKFLTPLKLSTTITIRISISTHF